MTVQRISLTTIDPTRNPLCMGAAVLLGVGFLMGGIFGHQVALIAVGGVIDATAIFMITMRTKEACAQRQKNKKIEAKFASDLGGFTDSNGNLKIPENKILATIVFQ